MKKREDGKNQLTERASDELEGSFGHSFGRRERSVDEMFDEVSGFVSYMEELVKSDPKELEKHRENLKALAAKSQILRRIRLDSRRGASGTLPLPCSRRSCSSA